MSAQYQPALPRWEHQDRALKAMNGATGFALFLEMRCGKSRVIFDEFGEDELNGAIERLLVVAPAGVYRVWEADARKHLGADLNARVKIACWESKAGVAAKRKLVEFASTPGPKILLVNVEALSTVKLARDLCTQFLNYVPGTLVIDESTTIRNHKALRTKFCLQLGRLADKRRILSGLPSPQSPLDLYAQFDFLEPGLLGFRNFSRFQQRYAVMSRKPFGPGGRMIDIVTGYQNLDELQERIKPHTFRVRLAECYQLPEKMYLRRDVEMTAEQERIYDEMEEYAVAELEAAEHVTATIVLTQLLRLHQILAGHTMSDNGTIVDIPENKTAEMLSILENCAGKAIIWAAYDADVRKVAAALEQVYGPGSVARFWGGNINTREAEEKAFKTDPKCRFMVATASAGGRGRTWDVADVVIYFSNTFSLEHRMQSEERAQMVGKTGSVAYFDMVTRNTVEEKIIEALRNKMDLSNAVTGDSWREWVGR